MFDAIVRSNGWDDATAALQLFSHLEGDALNVALLVPESRRASQVGLVGALTAHYGSPGRIIGANFRGPVHFCHSIRDVGDKGLWGHGSNSTASNHPGSVCGCTG